MKNVVIPEPIVFTVKGGARATALIDGSLKEIPTVTMYDFVMDSICSSANIGNGIEGAKRVRKLDRAFEDAKPGDVVGVEDADYKVVMEVISKIQWARPALAAQLLPLLEAWEVAEKQDEEWRKKQNLKVVE